MQEKKAKKAKLQIIFSAMILMLVFVMELYTMVNMSDQFIVMGGLGLVLLVCLYVLMSGLMTCIQLDKERKEEQYESIFKSEKASYLLLKKYFEEIEEKLDYLEKTTKVPTEEIVGTQKGIGKVIINRSRENAEAVMNSNDMLIERFDEFESALNQNKEQMISSYKSAGEDQLKQMLMKQQDIIMSMKDMELRLNNAIMQVQKSGGAVYAAPIPSMMPTMPNPVASQAMDTVTSTSYEEMSGGAALEEENLNSLSADDNLALDNVMLGAADESMQDEGIASVADEIVQAETEPVVEEMVQAEAESVVEEVAQAEAEPVVEEVAQAEAESVVEEVAQGEAEPAVEEIVQPEAEPVVEEVAQPEPEPAAEEKPPMPDTSDPNKQLSPDEIAALFANMGGELATPEDEAITAEVEAKEAAKAEPVAEEKPPMPDTSDPNKQLSPDEIAALFANMGGDDAAAPEPEPEPAPAPEIDLSDPNKQLSADEIAALFASMGS